MSAIAYNDRECGMVLLRKNVVSSHLFLLVHGNEQYITRLRDEMIHSDVYEIYMDKTFLEDDYHYLNIMMYAIESCPDFSTCRNVSIIENVYDEPFMVGVKCRLNHIETFSKVATIIREEHERAMMRYIATM